MLIYAFTAMRSHKVVHNLSITLPALCEIDDAISHVVPVWNSEGMMMSHKQEAEEQLLDDLLFSHI